MFEGPLTRMTMRKCRQGVSRGSLILPIRHIIDIQLFTIQQKLMNRTKLTDLKTISKLVRFIKNITIKSWK